MASDRPIGQGRRVGNEATFRDAQASRGLRVLRVVLAKRAASERQASAVRGQSLSGRWHWRGGKKDQAAEMLRTVV